MLKIVVLNLHLGATATGFVTVQPAAYHKVKAYTKSECERMEIVTRRFYSSRRRCLGTPRMFLFSSSPSSPPVRSARSLHKGHLVQFVCFRLCDVCVCAC